MVGRMNHTQPLAPQFQIRRAPVTASRILVIRQCQCQYIISFRDWTLNLHCSSIQGINGLYDI